MSGTEWGDEYTLTAMACVLRTPIHVAMGRIDVDPKVTYKSYYRDDEESAHDSVIVIGHIYELHYVSTKRLEDLKDERDRGSSADA